MFYLHTVFLAFKDIAVDSFVLSIFAKLQSLMHAQLAVPFPISMTHVNSICGLWYGKVFW
jgi:hypothetical protein